MEVAQNAHVMELERANTELRAELERTHFKKAPCTLVMQSYKMNVRAFAMLPKP
jgi:hypothetical protein